MAETAEPVVGDDEVIYCEVCREDVSTDELCGHIDWSESMADYLGCGLLGTDTDGYTRRSMFVVLDEIGPVVAAKLRAALVAHKYVIFNAGVLMCRSLCVWVDGDRENIGPAFTKHVPGDDMLEEWMSTGVLWLNSLEAGETDDADAKTVGWIDEWAAERREASNGGE